MKWIKKGQIFSTSEHGLLFAKSPQAVVHDSFIRIYFSTCEKDANKLISKIAYVDFDYSFKNVLRLSQKYVLSNGNLGCYDEHGIFPFSPFQHGEELFGVISGWTRRVSVSADAGIGIAKSYDNGDTFERLGNGPVLSSSLHEPFLISDGYVRYFNGIFHMWYIYGTKWVESTKADKEPERVYKIGHATSSNAIDWERQGEQIIEDRYDELECQALPCVINIEGRYHMFFCYRKATDFRNNRNRSYRIGYAYSDNLHDWVREDQHVGIEVSEKGWDSEMICYPNVFFLDDDIYLLYNGNQFGKDGFGLAKMEV